MSGKIKALGAVLAMVIAVMVGVAAMGATVFAEEPTPTPAAPAEEPLKNLLARVAEILNIDEQKVVDAFNQARQEMANEALEKALAKAVEEGRITQEEADQIIDWWGQRPEVLNKGAFPRLGRWGFPGGRMWGGLKGWWGCGNSGGTESSA